MTYTLTTLDNGLRVASETQTDAHCVGVAIAVNVGARYETINGAVNEGGLSHLLEHMAFKGTKTMNARQIAEAFDLMGGNVNAYTSHEHTVYYAKVLKEYANDATPRWAAVFWARRSASPASRAMIFWPTPPSITALHAWRLLWRARCRMSKR